MSFKLETITMTNRVKIRVDLKYSLIKSLNNYNTVSLRLLNSVITSVVTTVTNCLSSSTNRPIMTSNSDHQKQISLYIQLLASIVNELSFVSHDFFILVLSL